MQLRPLISAVCCSRPAGLSRVQSRILPLVSSALTYRSYSTTKKPKQSDPLHILFCGSDEFSCASLEALHAEHQRNPELITSIDVVVRPGKPTGRGHKKIRHPPILEVATKLGLPIHERDTFTGWSMPPSTNLIIAVSFGLFVPPRLINAAKYGGLNLHPSLLPDFRGPAPLHHTLLENVGSTGVTLQTLDTKAFDHGIPLVQTPLDGLYEIPPGSTVARLQEALTPLATRMLIEGLRNGVHVPPLQDRGWKALGDEGTRRRRLAEQKTLDENRRAPKIRPHDRQLFPPTYVPDPAETMTRQRVIGPLWFKARDRHGDLKRVIVEDMSLVEDYGANWVEEGHEPTEHDNPTSISGEGIANAPIIHMHRFTMHGQADAAGNNQPIERPVEIWFSNKDESLYILHRITRWSKPEQEGKSRHIQLGRSLKIDTLKVEGEKAKPAKLAFAQFECGSLGFEFLEEWELGGADGFVAGRKGHLDT